MCMQVLSDTEVDWVNAYHAEVWDKVSLRLSSDALEWLRTNTAPLSVPLKAQQVAAMAIGMAQAALDSGPPGFNPRQATAEEIVALYEAIH